MPFTTDVVILQKAYNADFSDFTNPTHAASKGYVDHKSGTNTSFINNSITTLRTEILGVTNQTLLTEMEQNYDTILEISQKLIESGAQTLTLANSIQQETNQRTAVFSQLSSNANNESSRAIQSENELRSQLDIESLNRASAISNEQTERVSSDNIHFNLINSETSNRVASLQSESSQRQIADQENKTSFETFKTSNDTKFNNISFDPVKQSYNFTSSISLDSTVGNKIYFNLSERYRTFATHDQLCIEFKHPLTNTYSVVFKISSN